jgi:hypothetical protein
VESETAPTPTEDLVSFVQEVVEWTRPISFAYLDDEQLDLLDQAREEIEDVQLPVIEKLVLSAPEEDLEAAGFTGAQTAFKLASARRAMSDSAQRAESPWPVRRKKALELLDFVVENVQIILGSLSSLSKWIEAAAELVGVVGSGVKATVAERGPIRRGIRKAKRWRQKRRKERGGEEPEEMPPSPAVA